MTRDTLLAFCREAPEGSMVALPRDVVLRELQGAAVAAVENEGTADYTIAEFAGLFNRSASTATQWCSAGLVPGAYKLQGRAWRVPRASVARFREAQRRPKTPSAVLLAAAHALHRRSGR